MIYNCDYDDDDFEGGFIKKLYYDEDSVDGGWFKLSFLENIMEEFYTKIYNSEAFKDYIRIDNEYYNDIDSLEDLK